jgi:hypothetical protein
VVQASIIIITTAAGRLQDLSHSSLDPAVTIWLAYASISVVIAGTLLLLSYTQFGKKLLPAARLAQVAPARLSCEIDQLWDERKFGKPSGLSLEQKESIIKSPTNVSNRIYIQWLLFAGAAVVVLIGWLMFALGVEWGVHGNVIAGTVGE